MTTPFITLLRSCQVSANPNINPEKSPSRELRGIRQLEECVEQCERIGKPVTAFNVAAIAEVGARAVAQDDLPAPVRASALRVQALYDGVTRWSVSQQ